MGSGRDKRKKHEDPAKAAKRALRQAAKATRGGKDGHEDPNGAPEGFNNEEAIEVTLTRIRKEEQRKRATVEKENVPPPSPRANVVFVPHPLKDQELVVFGGELWNGDTTVAYNDTYLYDVGKQRWAKVDTPVNPSPRSSAQGVVYKHFLVIHGGEFVSQSQSQFMHFKDVWRFDFKTYVWEELKTLKGGPSCRSGHRMQLWKRQAVVFGGFYDNAQECKYFNDLWILSELEAAGRWRQVSFPTHNDPPHARSGHAMALYQDSLFVYGGYSSAKFNRFKKSEATVHHDLWTTNLAAEQPVWTKIRLGGIPPPIRAGVAATCKDKRLLLFGGVVDIEAPGGKMVSSFHNDLFAFHMDTQRFYPLVLQPKKKQSQQVHGSKRDTSGGLAAELAELKLQNAGADISSEDSDDEEDDYDALRGDDNEAPSTGAAAAKWSSETNRHGQVLPHRRMDAAMCAVGNYLYLFGGQYESGKKEITITDLFSLNMNVMDSWQPLCLQDLGNTAWVGKDSESDAANSWESGSTVVSGVMFGDCGSDDDEDDDGDGAAQPDECPPDAIPLELDHAMTPGHEEIAGATVDGRTTIRGKKGMQMHKAQLLAQLDASSLVPTPKAGEALVDFFARTSSFWVSMAAEASGIPLDTAKNKSSGSKHDDRNLKRATTEGQRFCKTRYDEAIVLMEQLRIVEEREKEEAIFFKQMREKKQQDWEEEEQRQRTLCEEDGDAPDATSSVPRHEAAPKGILKKKADGAAVDLKAALRGGRSVVRASKDSDGDSCEEEEETDDED